LCHSTCYWYSC